jgi:hypothetical protein
VLEECIWPFAHDDCGAYEMDADGRYERPPAHTDGPRPDAQETVLALATKNRPRPSMKPWEAAP